MGFIDDKRTVKESSGLIKPRRTKGTYSYRFRNYFAAGVIGVGVLFGAVYMWVDFWIQDLWGEDQSLGKFLYLLNNPSSFRFLPSTGKIQAHIRQHMKEREEKKARTARIMSSFGPQLSAEGIQKVMEKDTYNFKKE
jgi:hypothetical protein